MSIGSQEEAGQSRRGAEVGRPARPRGDEELSAGRGQGPGDGGRVPEPMAGHHGAAEAAHRRQPRGVPQEKRK